MRDGIVATVTEFGMVGMLTNFGQDLPAAFAFRAAGDFDDCGDNSLWVSTRNNNSHKSFFWCTLLNYFCMRTNADFSKIDAF